MTRFDRYLFGLLITLFGFFALVLVGVYWINRAVALFDQIIADGQSAGVFLELTALTLPNVIRVVLPVPAFAAAVYVAHRLIVDSELVVAEATGLSPWRLIRPVALYGLVVALILSVLAHALVPMSRAALAERRAEIAENITARFLVEGRFQHPAEGITVYVREITPTGELRGLFLSDNRRPEARTTYTAARALLVRAETGPKLVMFEGMAQIFEPATRRLGITRFADFTYDLGALIGQGSRERSDPNQLSTSALLRADAAAQALTGKPRPVLLYEAHMRFAQPLMGLVGPLVGFAAMLSGGFSRLGPWRQVGLAVVILVLLQAMENFIADRALADSAWLPLVYLTPLAGLAAAAVLLARAGRTRRRRGGAPRAVPA